MSLTTTPNCTTRCGPAWSAKGPAPSLHRPRHDARPDRRRRSRRRQVRRRRPLPLRSARQHRLDRRRPQDARRQDREREGLVVGSVVAPGLAADRRRFGHGRARTTGRSSSARSARPAASADELPRTRRPPLRRRPHRLGLRRRRLGQGPRRATTERSPRRSARPATSPRITARSWPPRARSAGAACTRWKYMVAAARRWSDRPRRSASRPTWRTRCLYLLGYNAPEDRLLPERLRLERPGRASTGLQEAHRRAAPVDDRLPRRPERRARSRAPARTTRPAATAWPTIPTASSTSPATPATGCATTTGKLTRKIQHICWDGCMFPNAVMMQQQTWNDILAAMIAGARRTTAGEPDRGPHEQRPILEPLLHADRALPLLRPGHRRLVDRRDQRSHPQENQTAPVRPTFASHRRRFQGVRKLGLGKTGGGFGAGNGGGAGALPDGGRAGGGSAAL